MNMEQVGVGAAGTPYELDPGKYNCDQRIDGGQPYRTGRTAVGYSTGTVAVGFRVLLRTWGTDYLLKVGEAFTSFNEGDLRE